MDATRGTVPTTLKLPRHVDALWSEVSRHMGMNKTAVFALAIRELAKKENVPILTGDEEESPAREQAK
jgi:hypothetical protein